MPNEELIQEVVAASKGGRPKEGSGPEQLLYRELKANLSVLKQVREVIEKHLNLIMINAAYDPTGGNLEGRLKVIDSVAGASQVLTKNLETVHKLLQQYDSPVGASLKEELHPSDEIKRLEEEVLGKRGSNG